jgi:RNA polymerase sigma-70 factor, ECF subfamily
MAAESSSSEDAKSILSRYASEVRSFLRSRTTSRVSMEEVFSVFSEDLWKGLPGVRADGQVRSWIYVVARNALARHLRSKQRWRSRHVTAELDELQAERRSLVTQLGDLAELQPLLAAVPAVDRLLLEQRLVLSMPWRDIALARGLRGEVEIAREAARLRKRFQLLLRSLRQRAVAARKPVSE